MTSLTDSGNSLVSSGWFKAQRFGVLSVLALTVIAAFPLVAKAQISVDGTTATEVKGNVISPTGTGTVNGGNLYNSFDKFNVPNSGVIFNTGTSSVDGTKVNNIINRVTGDTPSSILGEIQSRSAFPNANLYLLNPNGIVFGTNARLDIGGSFYVTTGTGLGFDKNQQFSVDKNSLSFPSGDVQNIQFAIAQPAAIINQGNLTVDAGKNISFTAGSIVNTGVLTAPSGNVALTAVSGGSLVDLRSPDLVLGLSVLKNAVPTNWNGTISSLPKLAELLTGQVAQANQVVVKPDGSIALVASPNPSDIVVKDGMAIAAGKIDVSSSTGKGGNVGIFGNQVGLVNSLINASGNTGGGNVLIGGDLQGKGIAPNALQTYVDSSSQILANGILTGDGGKVIIWADRSTQFYGAIAAKGGDISGNGGFVEVSGKLNLDYQGVTNTIAPFGNTGTLLLDPTNITIVGIGGTASLISTGTSAVPRSILAFANNTPSSDATLNSSSIINLPIGVFGTSNVTLQATNDITFNAPINTSPNNAALNVTAQAGNNIIVNAAITSNGGNVRLIANDNTTGTATGTGSITINAPINTDESNAPVGLASGGNITLATSGAGSVSIGSSLTSFGGIIDITAGIGGVSITAPEINSVSLGNGSAGRININSSTGSLAIAGNLVSSSSSGNGGNVTLSALSGNISTANIDTNTNSTSASTNAGSLTINALNITNIGSIKVSANAGKAGDITLSGNLPLTSSTTFSTNSGSINGNIDLGNAVVTGNQSLTLNAGTGNVTLGAIGNSTTPLFTARVDSANIATFNGAVVAQTAGSSATNTIFNNADITGTVGIGFGNFTVNGNVTFTGNEVELQGLASGNGNLTITPFLSSLEINFGGPDTGALDLTPTDLSAFSNGTLGSLTIGNAATRGNIILTGNVVFAQPTTIQSPLTVVGRGINTSGFNLTNTGGSITLLADQNIITGNITAAGNAITITSTSGAINTSLGNLTTVNISGNSGNILYQAAGNITTSSINTFAFNGNAGSISLNTSGGTINTSLGSLNSTSNNGNGGDIKIIATNGNIVTSNNIFARTLSTNPSSSAGSITLDAINLTITDDLSSSAIAGTAKDIILKGNLPLTSNLTFFTSSNTGTSGNIDLANANIIGSQSLTLNAGSGNVAVGAIGTSLLPLTVLTITSGNTTLNNDIFTTNALNFNSPVILLGNAALTTTNSAIAFNNTVNGNQALSLNAGTNSIFFNDIVGGVTPLASLAIAPTSTLTSSSSIDVRTVGNITIGNISNQGRNISLISSNGNIDTSTGVIDTSISTRNSGDVFLQAGGNIIVKDVTTTNLLGNAGNISLVSLGGSINTSTGFINSRSSENGNGGDILLQAQGNITTAGLSSLANAGGAISSNGNSGNISLISNTGNIDTSLGKVESEIGFGNGDAGNILLQARNNITTSDLIARVISTTGGNGGQISVISGGDIRANGVLYSYSSTANGGNIVLQATGNITVSAPNGVLTSSALNGGDISFSSSGGAIDTTLSPINSSSSSTGKAGDILFQATGRVSTQDITATATTGNGGNITITVPNGTINTTFLRSSTTSSNTTSKAGLISLNTNNLVINGGAIDSSASNASGSNFIYSGNIQLLTDTTISTFGGTSNGEINLTNTNISGNQTLILNAGTSNVSIGTLGSSTVPIAGLNVTSGNINIGKDVFVNAPLSFNTPITLTSDTTITSSNITFSDTINGSQNLTLNAGSGNIIFNSTVGAVSALRNITANSSGITRFNSTVNAASLTTDASGTTELSANVTTSGAQIYNDAVNLLNPIQLTTTNNAIAFNAPVNGAFDLILNTNGNFIFASGAIGNTTPLASLAITPTSTLTSTNGINIITNGNISTGAIDNTGKSISLTSNVGAITIPKSITTANLSGQGGNIALKANSNLTTADIDSRSNGNQGGSILLTSQTGIISTGNINSSGKSGGEIFFNASTAINAGQINSSGTDKAGNVTLDPSGDVVVQSIDASSLLQGGNVTLVSTGGNLRITDSILSSLIASCNGSSICTSGGTGGSISLQTGGLNPFVVGDPSLNGSIGILTTGLSTIALNTSIPAVFGKIFIEGGISVAPGTLPAITKTTFNPPPTNPPITNNDPKEESPIGAGGIYKKEVDRYLSEGNLEKAFEAIENAYNSDLQAYSGNKLDFTGLTLEKAQDELQIVAERTGDVASLIYPILLDNRIEILVIPPKGTGKPFRRFSTAANQATVEALITDYRNNLRDVGSNDYLEQSQKLYDLLIRPIDSQLVAMKIKTLVFVMDSGLRVSPPAALHDGKQFLIERYAIANLPTMRAARIEERDRKTTRVLAMGLTESREGFSALPSVDIEIKTIASNVLSGTSFLNENFTVNNLQKQRNQGKYTILHLGTHAKFVSETNQDSFIQFWDSRLKLSQIPKLRFDEPVIDMLTLSACQTAVGNNLGISGLAVESGAKSVLASLWEVSDAGTAPLMIRFYKAFPEAVNKAQAMQQAQISLLNGKVKLQGNKIIGIEGFPSIPLPLGLGEIDLSHPFYWSSFILVGNWL